PSGPRWVLVLGPMSVAPQLAYRSVLAHEVTVTYWRPQRFSTQLSTARPPCILKVTVAVLLPAQRSVWWVQVVAVLAPAGNARDARAAAAMRGAASFFKACSKVRGDGQ